MDRTDWFLALITYLLAAQFYVNESGVPDFVALLVLVILYGLPIYLFFQLIVDGANLLSE